MITTEQIEMLLGATQYTKKKPEPLTQKERAKITKHTVMIYLKMGKKTLAQLEEACGVTYSCMKKTLYEMQKTGEIKKTRTPTNQYFYHL